MTDLFPTNKKRVALVSKLIQTIEDAHEREGLVDTPLRVDHAFAEMFSGYSESPESVLDKKFSMPDTPVGGNWVVIKDIQFFSYCEHHMIPFYGTFHIGYLPNPEYGVIGISKVPRLVEIYAKRLQIQERLTGQVVDALFQSMKAPFVIGICKAKHLCMGMRGVRNPSAETITQVHRKKDGMMAEEEFSLIKEFHNLLTI